MKIDPKKWYNSNETGILLKITPETVKAYCRDRKVHSKKVGPKKQWHVQGTEILRLQKEWNLDTNENYS